MLKKTVSMAIVSAAIAVAISGCNDSKDSPRIYTYGEVGIEQGIPATVEQLSKLQTNPTVNAESIVENMTDRERIGQVIALDFRKWGKNADDSNKNMTVLPDELADVINDYALGSMILFRGNVEKNDETYNLIKAIQGARYKLPLFMGVDQEGGYVTRLQQGTELPGNMALAASRDTALAREAGRVHGKELKVLGFHFNFAPVVDVNVEQQNPVIGVRSYSSNTQLVIDMSTAYINGLHSQGIMGSAKHFPGHGNTAKDTHFGVSTVLYSEAEWREKDLPPFKAAISNGIDSIMTAHVTFPNIDDTKIVSKHDGEMIPLPSTLSKKILTDILRNELRYDGLIFTDALEMEAISTHIGTNEAVEIALLAGVDIALMPVIMTDSDQLPRLEELYLYLEEKMSANSELANRVRESAIRVVKKKLEKRISYEQVPFNEINIVGSAEHKATEKRMAEKAITLIKNNGLLPYKLGATNKIVLISDADARNQLIQSELSNIENQVSGISVSTESAIFNLMSDFIGAEIVNEDKEKEKEEKAKLVADTMQKITDSELVIIIGHSINKKPGAAQQAIDWAKQQGKPVVLIAGRNPYDIAYVDDVAASIAIYGVTGYDQTNQDRNSLEANIRAGVRSMFTADGAPIGLFFAPTGKLPVDIKSADSSKVLYPFGHGLTY